MVIRIHIRNTALIDQLERAEQTTPSLLPEQHPESVDDLPMLEMRASLAVRNIL